MTSSPRLARLRSLLSEAGLDGLALVPGSNLHYLTGSQHGLMERLFLVFVPLRGQPVAVLPALEADLFTSHGFEARLYPWTDAQGYETAFTAALNDIRPQIKKLAVEGLRMRFFESELLRQHAPDITLINGEATLENWRIRKDADEIAALQKAIQLSESALEKTLAQVRLGMTERQIASILELEMKNVGGEGNSFETIVLGGGNSALPHGHPGDYALQSGDALLFDFGTKYGGYGADITRTFFLGEPDSNARAVYEAVLSANTAARAAAKPGVSAESVDAAARAALIEAGFEHLIKHRTGHGLGLEIHEHPNIVSGNTRLLEPGMVFTIEPGLYQTGVVGVRIEDNVVVTEDGLTSLTTFPRELRVLPV